MKVVQSLLLIIAIVLAALIGAHFLEKGLQTRKEAARIADLKARVAEVTNPFPFTTYNAKAVCMIDATSGQTIYQSNGDQALPLASMTKVMTAYLALKSFARTDTIFVDPTTKSFTPEDKALLGHTWSFDALLSALLINSSNTAADALAATYAKLQRGDFVTDMNRTSQVLGLGTLSYKNPSGIDLVYDTHREGGGMGSACDSARMLVELQKKYPGYALLSAKMENTIQALDGTALILHNTDPLPGEKSGILASKTGSTTLAGGNLSLVYSAGGEIFGIVVIGAQDETARLEEMRKLLSNTDAFMDELEKHEVKLAEYLQWRM